MKDIILNQITKLQLIQNKLKTAFGFDQKVEILNNFAKIPKKLKSFIHEGNIKELYLILSLSAIEQEDIVFQDIDLNDHTKEAFTILIDQLSEIDKFYEFMGGIVGYHLSILTLINSSQNPSKETFVHTDYEQPYYIDIISDTPETRNYIRFGIESLPLMSEIYPLGGAGDRLNLIDQSGETLPAAELLFCGVSLLEGLIRDLQGREFLYYKLFGKQINTPIAIMTSHEKNNRHHIEKLLQSNNWFNRQKSSFDIFIQIRVPMITIDGNWAMIKPLTLMLKPGGHGVLWKTAEDAGVFDRLEQSDHTKMLVRQINNPVAGIDKGLLSLIGIGCHENKAFGFASCPRLLNMPEGMDVLRKRQQDNMYEYCLTNIEYTDFKQQGIEDTPYEPGSPYSQYPANSNILFVDLPSLKSALKICQLPGLLINMKSEVPCYMPGGHTEKHRVVRLESTMQNIADYITDSFNRPITIEEQQKLRTFMTYNQRRKTLSVTKQLFQPGHSPSGTPEWCFYESMQNYHELLVEYCQIQLPQLQNEDDYFKNGPNIVTLFHPTLGGLYSIIGQKICGGCIESGSEWIMEIAEAQIINLNLKGSLSIKATEIMGENGNYDSFKAGKCTLINIRVQNLGVKPTSLQNIWQRKVEHLEQFSILIHGNGEFYAKDVIFSGNQHIVVHSGTRLTAYMDGERIAWKCENISQATWTWDYCFDTENRIALDVKRF